MDSISLGNFQHLNQTLIAKHPTLTLVPLGQATNVRFGERLFNAPIAR